MPPTRQVALFRGMNVGRARRVAMADLRVLFESLGFRDVRTLLQSGNVVFTPGGRARANPAARIEAALARELGIEAAATVLDAAGLSALVEENPLLGVAHDPRRLLAAVLREPAGARSLREVVRGEWEPEAIALGKHAAYLWCPDGIHSSRLVRAVDRALGAGVTMRNWSTVLKLQALVAEGPG